MHARDRSVEGKRNVVRWRQTDRDPVAPKGDPVSRAPDPHLEMIVPLALRAIGGIARPLRPGAARRQSGWSISSDGIATARLG